MKMSLLLTMPILITGCATQRDNELWSIGVVVYGLYLFGLLLTFLVPALHQTKVFKQMMEVIKIPAVVVADVIAVIGFFTMIGGVVVHDQALTYHLIPLVGCVVFVLGQCIRMWATCHSPERQSIYAKAIAISAGCIIALNYVINGAELLNF